MFEIDYDTLENEAVDLINAHHAFVLATALNDGVTARTVSVVSERLLIWFQTGSGSEKVGQMRQNHRVALCANNIQIEGIARLTGHPVSPKNKPFLDLYQDRHRMSFLMYSDLVDEIVVAVEPLRLEFWKYASDGSSPCLDILDVEKHKAFREVIPLVKKPA